MTAEATAAAATMIANVDGDRTPNRFVVGESEMQSRTRTENVVVTWTAADRCCASSHEA